MLSFTFFQVIPAFYLVALVTSTSQILSNLSSPPGPVVNLGYAAFVGNTTAPSGELNGPVSFFGGIPYAQPPVGDLRFRAPRMLDETFTNGTMMVTDARNWGAPCIQQPAQVGVGNEDCLTLDIWAPIDAAEGDNLPVLFYIHGGGFRYGLPQGFPLYELVNQSNPKIIAVSVTYRLNLLGFLASEAVRADGDLNVGLLDQRAGMEWVQRHISKFGGDPSSIVIDGESAGAGSVLMHLVSYGGMKPVPFRRAIAQSIAYERTPTENDSEGTFKTVIDTVGCSNGPNVMACLRNASIGAISAAINAVPIDTLQPVVDGVGGYLPDLPAALIRSGNFNVVDFVGGHCTNDGTIFAGGTPDQFVTDQDIENLVFARWGNAISNATKEAALALYPVPNTVGGPFTSQYSRASAMAGDMCFTCMDWFLADALKRKGAERTFTSRFNSPNPVLLESAPYEGTMHTSDLFFLMMGETAVGTVGSIFTQLNDTEEYLSEETLGYWASFASSGDTSMHRLPSSPAWTQFTPEMPLRMVLSRPENLLDGTASMMEMISRDEIERCKFWMSANVTAQTGL